MEKEYRLLLASGLFFEIYPQLTGNYTKDLPTWIPIYRKLQKLRKKVKDEKTTEDKG